MKTITELGFSLDIAKSYIKRHVCEECGAMLELAWGGNWQIEDYVIRCGRMVTHNGIVPARSLKEEFEQRRISLKIFQAELRGE